MEGIEKIHFSFYTFLMFRFFSFTYITSITKVNTFITLSNQKPLSFLHSFQLLHILKWPLTSLKLRTSDSVTVSLLYCLLTVYLLQHYVSSVEQGLHLFLTTSVFPVSSTYKEFNKQGRGVLRDHTEWTMLKITGVSDYNFRAHCKLSNCCSSQWISGQKIVLTIKCLF